MILVCIWPDSMILILIHQIHNFMIRIRFIIPSSGSTTVILTLNLKIQKTSLQDLRLYILRYRNLAPCLDLVL